MPDIAAGRSNSAGKIGGRADYFRICRLQPAGEEWPACMVRLEKEKAGFGYTHFKTKTRGLLTREEIWERRICRPPPVPRQIADGESERKNLAGDEQRIRQLDTFDWKIAWK